MARGYTENETRLKVKKLLNSEPRSFYKENILNYRGKISDNSTPYSEVIADELFQNFDILSQLERGVQIRNTKSFDRGHDGKPNIEARRKRFGEITYSEKLLAIALYNSTTAFEFGKIFDYQVPMKEKQDDSFGEVDLVALDQSSIKLIELKIKGTGDETLLRALLEVYTYYKIINGSLDKFIHDFKLSQQQLSFQPCIITDRDALSGKTMHNLTSYPCTVKLIGTMQKEIDTPIELYTYEYPSQEIRLRSDSDNRIDLVGDIQFKKIEI